MKKNEPVYLGDYTVNKHGITCKKCCLSCKYQEASGESYSLCNQNSFVTRRVGRYDVCPHFKLKEVYEEVGGNPTGRVKRKSYLEYYSKNVNSDVYKFSTDRIADIHKDYEEDFGQSVYLNEK